MCTHNIPFSVVKNKITPNFSNLRVWDFPKGVNNEFEIAVVNEQSVFESLKVY